MLTKIDIVWFWLISFATVHAAELPSDPILRIETGMHTAPIRRISVDTTERFLLTAAEDKTLRLWELATGNLLKIYRPPIGTGADEGIIYAGALSPDGEWVAGSGWTGVEWDGKVSIYLFNRATGKLVKRLTGLEQIIFHLCFSPDGQYLAATLGGGWGVRVWETHTWQRVLNDAGYADSSYSCDFDAQNRLVTSAWDGFIRLYALVEGQFTLVARNTAPGGKQPATVAFNPAGDQLAVGFDDSTQVNVLSGQDLTFRYAPDTTGVDNGTLSKVAWSQGSNRLYAGGSYSNQPGILPILHWPQVGQGGHYTLWPASSNAIFDIHALKNGYMVYSTANPSFAVLDNTGNKVIEQVATIADYRDNLSGFKLSAEGSTLQFGFEQWGEHPARFSLTDQRLLLNPQPDNALQPPNTTSLNIVNWLHTDTPTLNDIPLKLEPYEISHSLAIVPDKSQFLLGTDWSLYLFDAQGQQQWRASVPSIAWGVNISGDGQKGVAALGDGTIRWYNLATGQELLAFFPHNDGQRWIVWIPSGYYMSSGENANNLIGWHINQGKDQTADFWPISVLSATYQRPDIVKRVLITLDESEAIHQVKLETGESLAPPEKLATALKKKTEYLLELNPSGLGKAVIVAASGEQGTNSLFPYTNAATTEMYRLLRQRGLTDGDIIYLNPLPPIVPADGYVDAGRQDFPMREPLVELTQAITQAKNDLQPGQQFIFYLHGHAKPNVLELKLKPEPGIDISADQLKTLLAQIPHEIQQIIILDTCHSGSFFDELTDVPNRILISSADTDSKAFSPQAGSFAEYFIKYLQEKGNLGEAFDEANRKILEQSDLFSTQRPQLDDTQDGQFDDRDGQVAHRTYLGKQKLHGALPPEITVTHSPLHLVVGQTTATLWVKAVPDFNGMKQVRALLVNEQDQPPEYQGESTLFSRRELILQPNYELQRYETHYDQFHTATRWKILYQAQSNEGDWSEVRVGYVVQGESPIVTQVKPHLNKTRYHPGDTIRFTVQITGEVLVDVYVGVVFPDGAFQTIAYPLNFSLVSTLHPYQTQLQLTGEQTLPIFNLPLPAIPIGRYQMCGLLTKPQSDPLNQENWLDFNCEEFEFSG